MEEKYNKFGTCVEKARETGNEREEMPGEASEDEEFLDDEQK